MFLIIILFLIFLLCFKFVRCALFNFPYVYYYGVRDIYDYFRFKKWENFSEYGIDMFVGMFGHGKTLSMVHRARKLYALYGDNITFISNFHLETVPYIPLINFNQLVELGADENSNKSGYVVLIDEISSVLSHRNYSSFPLELIGLLCQQRKRHVYIMCTAQRFFMVDKIWRSITTHVIDCNKLWRFQHCTVFDGWEYENAMNSQLIQRLNHNWYFIKQGDFDCYDTSQMITKESVNDFISNEESIVRKGLDSMVNELAVKNPTKKMRKRMKRK